MGPTQRGGCVSQVPSLQIPYNLYLTKNSALHYFRELAIFIDFKSHKALSFLDFENNYISSQQQDLRDHLERKRIITLTSYNVCIPTMIFKLEMIIFMTHNC